MTATATATTAPTATDTTECEKPKEVVAASSTVSDDDNDNVDTDKQNDNNDNNNNNNESINADESLLQPLREALEELIEKEGWKQEQVLKMCRGGQDDNDNYDFLRRCLIHRNNHLKKAIALAAAGLRWRESVQPWNLTVADFPIANSQGVFSFAGFSKKTGWPILHALARNWDPWKYSLEEYVKKIAFLFEQVEQSASTTNQQNNQNTNQHQRLLVVIDVRGMSKFNVDFSKLRALIQISCDYYPERLGLVVVCHADFVTRLIWNFVSPLMDKPTRDRVKMCRGYDDYHDILEDYIGMEHIGPALGGLREEGEWPTLSEENQFDWKEKKN